MKLIAPLLFSFVLLHAVVAQDLQTAKNHFDRKDYSNAKKSLQAAQKTSASKTADYWLLEYRIDSAIAANKQFDNTYPQALSEACTALLNIAALPQSETVLTKLFGLNYLQLFNDCYTGLINKGSAAMNVQQPKEAFLFFKSALAVSGYFFQQRLILNQLDTSLCFYAGYNAMQAKDYSNAEYYFKKLADNNCSGADINIGYGWLCNYYLQDKKDIAQAKTVCEKGLKYYPADEYLNSKWKDILEAGGDTKALINAYETTIANGKGSFTDYLGYSAWLYDYLYIDNAGKPEDAQLVQRLGQVIKEALRLNSKSAQANYLAGMYHSTLAVAQNQQNSKTPSESLKKQQDENVSAAITYLETTAALYEAGTNNSAGQKEHHKTALLQLANLYKFTGQAAKQEATAAKAAKL